MVKDETIKLYEYLAKQFSSLKIVHSGREFHIHVFDREAYMLKAEERKLIAKDVKARGFQIDTWVTAGDMRLIRLPYSLNGLVSRIVIQFKKMDIESFNPVNDYRYIPDFLKQR